MRLLTADEYCALPAKDDDRCPYRDELIRGVVCVREPFPSPRHQAIEGRLIGILYAFVSTRRLGMVYPECGFLLERNPDTVRGADVAFVSTERLALYKDEAYFPTAPDLAIEVLSPSNRKQQMAERVKAFFAVGVRLIWCIDPNRRTVTVHRPDSPDQVLGIADALSGDEVIPGFACRVSDIFD
jgi:Uma2 family endonuclease